MKRFYKQVDTAPAGGGWQVRLDGRGVKTQGGQQQVVPTPALADALAAEWAAQAEEIDPATLILRDLTDYAIDVVRAGRPAAIADLLRYAETDTLCYRADPDEPLHPRQAALWDPLLSAAEARWDIRFVRVCGVLHRPQPPETLARLEGVVAGQDNFSLAALNTLTTLAASLVIGLAALEPGADLAALWQAAELEEQWQADLWGREDEAEARRARRLAAFTTAARFAGLARS